MVSSFERDLEKVEEDLGALLYELCDRPPPPLITPVRLWGTIDLEMGFTKKRLDHFRIVIPIPTEELDNPRYYRAMVGVAWLVDRVVEAEPRFKVDYAYEYLYVYGNGYTAMPIQIDSKENLQGMFTEIHSSSCLSYLAKGNVLPGSEHVFSGLKLAIQQKDLFLFRQPLRIIWIAGVISVSRSFD